MSVYRMGASIFIGLLCLFFPFSNALAHHPAGSTPQGDEVSGIMLNSPTAATLGMGQTSAGFHLRRDQYNTIPAENAHALHHDDRDVHGLNHEEFYLMTLGRGVTDDFDLALSIPIVSKTFGQIDDHDALGRKEHSDGLGDVRLTGKWRLLKSDWQLALLVGAKFPTGETSNRDKSNAKIETELQPGSGSWDGDFGVVLSRTLDKGWFFSTSFEYFLKGEGATDRKLGDVFRYSAGVSKAVNEHIHLVLETNVEWALKDRARNDDRVFDSGGTSIFLTPGIDIAVTDQWMVYVAAPVPVFQDLGGEHEEIKFSLLAGTSYRF